MRRIFATGLLAVVGVLALESTASAQEIQLTGPLAGAPAVRELRWHRNKRFEIAPSVSFSLLDEYQRTIFVGARFQYNFTDWLGVGVWGAYGVAHLNTGLTDEIDKVNKKRWSKDLDDDARNSIDRNSSLLSVGYDFPSQLGKIEWVVAPQITAVPFRGKLAIFEAIFVDTDLFFFAGPAIIGVKERDSYTAADLAGARTVFGDVGKEGGCDVSNPSSKTCKPAKSYPMASRVAIAPTFGAGLTFFPGDWAGIGIEYRAMPFSWNTSGFDSKGGPPDGDGPDYKVNNKDRQFRFNQMITLSFNIFLPTAIKTSP